MNRPLKSFAQRGSGAEWGRLHFAIGTSPSVIFPMKVKSCLSRVRLRSIPSHFSRRIAAQRSRLTIFGKEPDLLKNLVNGKIANFTLSAKLSLKSSASLMVWHEPALAGRAVRVILRLHPFWVGCAG